MADKTVKLTAPTGATVSVTEDKVDGLLGRGFTKATAAKKAESSSKSKSSK